MIEGFHDFEMFSLSLPKISRRSQGNFTKDAGQKMFTLWQTHERLIGRQSSLGSRKDNPSMDITKWI